MIKQAKLIGLSIKVDQSPFDSMSARLRLLSNNGPSIIPNTIGAMENESLRSMNPTIPAIISTHISNMEFFIAKEPTRLNTIIAGMRKRFGKPISFAKIRAPNSPRNSMKTTESSRLRKIEETNGICCWNKSGPGRNP